MAPFPEGFNARLIKPYVYRTVTRTHAETCSVEGCDRKYYGNDLCHKHYQQVKKHGKILSRTRFMENQFEILDGNTSLMSLYNRKGEVIAKAIVDTEDVPRLRPISWSLQPKNYVGNKEHKLHQFVMQSKELFDHIDTNPLNNKKSNLRTCDNQQNSFNRNTHKDNRSGIKGVTLTKYGMYQARITFNGKERYLGTFRDPIQAAEVYNLAALESFGEFAKLNDIEALERKQQAAQPT